MEKNNTTFKHPGDLDSEIWEWLKEHGTEETKQVIMMTARHFAGFIAAPLKQEQPEVQNGKFAFPKYLYARTRDNKTIDMSYAPQDMTAIEYVRNDFVEQEQPEVDLEKEIARFVLNGGTGDNTPTIGETARHFYELGLNARKEESE